MKISPISAQAYEGKVILNLNSLPNDEKYFTSQSRDEFIRELRTLKRNLENSTPHDETYRIKLSTRDESNSTGYIDISVDKVSGGKNNSRFRKPITSEEEITRHTHPTYDKTSVENDFRELSRDVARESRNERHQK